MNDSQVKRKVELDAARTKINELNERKIEDIAHEVGIKGLVSDMEAMGTEGWETTRTYIYWLLNNTDYPYDKTVIDLYADIDACIKGHNEIRFL